jgi:hypothetical protein
MIQTAALRLVGRGLSHVLSDVLLPASQTVVAGTFNTAYIGLFTAWPGFSLGLQMGQLTEPGFGGYARQKVTWGDEGIDKNQRPQVMGGLSQFQPSDSSATATVIGAFVADAATAGNLLAVGLLPQSIVLGTPVDLLALVGRLAIPGLDAPDWGEVAGVA